MEKTYIFGTNALAMLLHHYLRVDHQSIDGFVLNRRYINDGLCENLPDNLNAIEEIIDIYGAENVSVFVPIGYTQMNETRSIIFSWLKERKIKILTFIHPSAVIAANTKIGEGCIILENVVLQPFTILGEGNILWNGTNICHHTEIGNFNWFAPSVTLSGRVKIFDNCFLGSSSVCKNDIVLHNKVLVGAGAYVYKSLQTGSVFVPQHGVILEKTSEEIVLI